VFAGAVRFFSTKNDRQQAILQGANNSVEDIKAHLEREKRAAEHHLTILDKEYGMLLGYCVSSDGYTQGGFASMESLAEAIKKNRIEHLEKGNRISGIKQQLKNFLSLQEAKEEIEYKKNAAKKRRDVTAKDTNEYSQLGEQISRLDEQLAIFPEIEAAYPHVPRPSSTF